MKFSLFVLLMAPCVSTGVFDFKQSALAENFSPVEERMGNKPKRKLERMKEVFDNSILGFRERLGRYSLEKQDKLRASELQKELKKLEKFGRKSFEKVQRMGDSIEEITMKSRITHTSFHEDETRTNEQQDKIAEDLSGARPKRQAYNDEFYPGHRWPDGVPYVFVSYLGEKAKSVFKKAADLWMKNTCIDFKEYQLPLSKGIEMPSDFLYVYDQEGCSSDVGRKGSGPQPLSLARGCEVVGIAAHEIAHALGFFHTQERHDRDEHVKVNKQNIYSELLVDFDKKNEETNNNYGLTYDYGSIMHYGAMSSGAAIDKTQPIIVPNDVNYAETLGSHIIAFYDLLMMNKYYNCLDACKGKEADCKNGGFAHPRNCSTCVCPSGYGGELCGERPSGCGGELEASEEWALLENSLDGVKGDERDGYKRCNYWIKAKNDKKIEVKISELSVDVAVSGCIYAGVEIKTHSDQRRTGYRFCSNDDVSRVLKSNLSIVPVITYNARTNATTTKLQYRISKEH